MVMGAQDFVSFGYRSQSRETMEYSAKSECDGAFERRRETSPLPPRKPNSPVVKQDKYEQDMDQMKTAQGDLAVNMDQMETTQGDLAFMDTMDLIKQGQSNNGYGYGNNGYGYGNNEVDTNAVEEKQAAAATARNVDEPIETSALDGAANTGRVHEVMLALTRLPAHQRRVLSAKLREVQEDTSIDQDQKAKSVSDLLNKWLKGEELRAEARFASEEISDDEEVEMPATSEEQGEKEMQPKQVLAVGQSMEAFAVPERAWEVVLSRLSSHQRDKLREILNDETSDLEWRAKMVSALLE